MIKLLKLVFLTVSLSSMSLAYAAVPVINGYDSDANSQNSQVIVTDQADGPATANTTVATNNSTLPIKQRISILESQVANFSQMLTQFNQLQSQLQDLRGELEVQKHTIKVLQDQLSSQYQDLDQRLNAQAKNSSLKNNAKTAKSDNTDITSDNSAGADTTSNSTANTNDAATGAVNAATANKNNNEDQKVYQAAIDLLKNKKYPQATLALQKFIKQYPASEQNNNARFWLGQLYLLQGQPDKALDQFHTVLKKNPANKKAPDILLQVGLAYYAKSDLDKAQDAFKKVAQKYPNSAAAKLAQARLKLIQQANGEQPAAGATDSSN